MQRLYSSFANGWAGHGLLILRVVCAGYMLCGPLPLASGSSPGRVVMIGVSLGIGCLLILGCWTPITASVGAVLELWQAFSYPPLHWSGLLSATIAASLALLGPGAWSIDARRYGRRRVVLDRK